jgi:FixJ family two-component response regulator
LSKPPLIAIVDDDRAMREALLDLLQVEGLPARTFGDAAAFLASAAVTEFGCLITDVRMPGIDGLELQKCLRARGSSIPIIFVTSDEDEATRAQAMSGGATAYFTKPLANAELVRSLALALDGRPGR